MDTFKSETVLQLFHSIMFVSDQGKGQLPPGDVSGGNLPYPTTPYPSQPPPPSGESWQDMILQSISTFISLFKGERQGEIAKKQPKIVIYHVQILAIILK